MYGLRSKNKYNAYKCEYKGVEYASRIEAQYALILDSKKKNKEIKDWERQIKIPLVVNGQKICTYICDFKVIHNDDSEEYIEVKGFETPSYKLKAKLLKALYPDIKYTVEK